mmetsp:Transcript_19721/g.54843  ORF Transcript_19721/g.54843 Transcript_19721/m.54843 type:complete len:174 (+) Transcript_19721:174-695(+)
MLPVLSYTSLHSMLLALLFVFPFAFANRFQEAFVMNCVHTFSDGTTYDLTPLTRTAGRPDYVGRDKEDDLYYMNVCANVQEVPQECKMYRKEVKAPVYQVRNDTYCHWLGLEANHEWDYIERGSPYVGVQITYSDGELCEEGVRRQVRCVGRMGLVRAGARGSAAGCSSTATT